MNPFSVVGFLAAILTTIAFLPQVVKSFRTKKTRDVSILMVFVQASGNALWTLYGVLIQDVAIAIANGATLAMVVMLIILKIKYK